MATSISAIIPAYNRPAHLADCIKSIREQTSPPSEIIIVDDGSTSEGAAAIRAFGNEARIVRLERNRGPSAARNAGAAHAVGELLAFLDSDDMWAPTKLEEQIAFLAANSQMSAVHTGVIVFLPNGEEKRYLSKPAVLTLDDLVESSHITPPSLVIRTEVFRKIGGFDETYRSSEDYDFAFRLLEAGEMIGFIPRPLTLVRRGHGDHLSAGWWRTLKGHLKVVWRHRDTYRHCQGRAAVRKHMGKYVRIAGAQRGGVFGRVLRVVGHLAGQ